MNECEHLAIETVWIMGGPDYVLRCMNCHAVTYDSRKGAK